MSGKLKSYFNSTVGLGDEIKSFLFTADGTAITQTGGALDVNIASSDIQIDVDLDHANDSVKVGDGTDFLAINNDGSINAVVTATDLDIRNLVFANDKVDVSGSSNVAVVDGGGSLTVDAVDLDIRNLVFANDKVDVTGSSVSITGDVNVTQGTSPWVVSATNLDIRDLTAASDSVAAWTNDGAGNAIGSLGGALRVTDHADTITQAAPVISNTATAIAAAATQTRILIQNLDEKIIYIGDSGVTSGTGYPVDKNEFLELPFSGTLYAITASGSTSAGNVRVLKLSA